MSQIQFQSNYISSIVQPILASTLYGEELEIVLSQEPISNIGYLIIDKGDVLKEEKMFYHRKEGTSVFVYGINRQSPHEHEAQASVLLANSIDGMNHLSQGIGSQMSIYKVSEENIFIEGGKFFINKKSISIPDCNTSDLLLNQTLSQGVTNYIYIKDNKYFITTTLDIDLFPIGEVVTSHIDNSIESITRYNTVSFYYNNNTEISYPIYSFSNMNGELRSIDTQNFTSHELSKLVGTMYNDIQALVNIIKL